MERAQLFAFVSVALALAVSGLLWWSGRRPMPEPMRRDDAGTIDVLGAGRSSRTGLDRPWHEGRQEHGKADAHANRDATGRGRDVFQRRGPGRGFVGSGAPTGQKKAGGGSSGTRTVRGDTGSASQPLLARRSLEVAPSELLDPGKMGDRFDSVRAPASQSAEAPADQVDGGPGDAPSEAPEGLTLSLPFRATTAAEDATQPIVEQDVIPADGGEGMDFDEHSILAYPNAGNVNPAAGTISFDIEPHWNGEDPGDNSLVQLRTPDVWANRLQIYRNGVYLRFILTTDNGQEAGVGVSIRDWMAGDRHTVTASWGDGVASLYIDGELAKENPYDGQLEVAPGTPLYVGSNLPNSGPSANAILQGFKVYGSALTPEDLSNQQ